DRQIVDRRVLKLVGGAGRRRRALSWIDRHGRRRRELGRSDDEIDDRKNQEHRRHTCTQREMPADDRDRLEKKFHGRAKMRRRWCFADIVVGGLNNEWRSSSAAAQPSLDARPCLGRPPYAHQSSLKTSLHCSSLVREVERSAVERRIVKRICTRGNRNYPRERQRALPHCTVCAEQCDR